MPILLCVYSVFEKNQTYSARWTDLSLANIGMPAEKIKSHTNQCSFMT